MNIIKKHWFLRNIIFLCNFLLIFGNIKNISAELDRNYQGSLHYLGNSANDDDRGGLFNETQGIANGEPSIGDNYWYFSKNIDSNRNTYIYRVNYSNHLANNFPYDPRRIRLPGPNSGQNTCDHIGDIDYHVFRGIGYIVAPYEDCGDHKGRIAFFLAKDIDGRQELLNPISVMLVDSVQNGDAPWVSVGSNGRIYSSMGSTRKPDRIFEYDINWTNIETRRTSIPFKARIVYLEDEYGSPLSIIHKQGADFSTDGNRFYVVNGYQNSSKDIHVFVTSDKVWRRIDKSSRTQLPFKFETHGSDEEPQGLSLFDVNYIKNYHPRMPRGELHVLLLNNDIGDDNLWIKHYSYRK
jgi:hypothetical protein